MRQSSNFGECYITATYAKLPAVHGPELTEGQLCEADRRPSTRVDVTKVPYLYLDWQFVKGPVVVQFVVTGCGGRLVCINIYAPSAFARCCAAAAC
jgi:hypothetical protein